MQEPDYSAPFIESEARSSTPGGSGYRIVAARFQSGEAYFLIPDATESWTHTTLLHVVHGMTGSRGFYENPVVSGIAEHAIDNGWIVASASHGNSWGNKKAMRGLQNCYGWVARRWWIDNVLMAGHSMGGMAVLVAASQKIVPDMAGVVSINGMIDVYDYHSASTLAAYGVSTWDALPAAIAGHDPANDPAENWADMPIQLISTTSDTSDRQAQRFLDRAATPELIDVIIGSHTHVQNPYIAEANTWLDTLAEPYVTGQQRDDQPVPKWDGWDAGAVQEPQPVSGSVVYTTDGREVSLYRADGTLVRL